ncbi:MAG TPA: PilZ domain-containing protein [Holophagaceae bacterium]|nr:PilZ domain-containing protein [Holophagaceae bacterium]
MAPPPPQHDARHVEDPALVQEALAALLESGAEFPLLNESAQSLPYTARLQAVEPEPQAPGSCLFRLHRALPPNLPPGSLFRLTFGARGERYDGVLRFIGREDYLLYRFETPRALNLTGRAKRIPFRPREGATVTLWDGEKAISGSLLNLSTGGLGFRVERVFRQDTLARLRPDTSLFHKGQLFLGRAERIRNCPDLAFRAQVAHVAEAGREVRLGMEFLGPGPGLIGAVEALVQLREQSAAAAPGATGRNVTASFKVAPAAPEPPPPVLLPLRRRCAPIVLAMPPGEARQALLRGLAREGFQRILDEEAHAGTALVLVPEEREDLPEALPFDPEDSPAELAQRLDTVLGLRL